ncbi:hypothetical protein HL658_28880 [Azospirillum sp. RWY-5-1]|uniref:4Fe4S-binding SPASM domain-containing protein n=1 Tax=Azospirillum oleiclasticum TaxID=2735135 RepID=A0ABX2TIV7_9PROT|nr:SPASM domain-containing protein [Azospirillum oleiclasticum]NYZ16578.1 hypothetical protein [Azospirillum oleiclasticum]NYZ23952.1 hypothetical protein [Azospirillum oleiclasticum]
MTEARPLYLAILDPAEPWDLTGSDGAAAAIVALERNGQDAAAALLRALDTERQGGATAAYDARPDYRFWLESGDPLVCSLRADAPDGAAVVCLLPPDRTIGTPVGRPELLIHLARAVSAMPGTGPTVGALFEAARALFRRGDHAAARAAVAEGSARGRHPLLDMAGAVLAAVAEERPIPPYLEDVFGTSDHFATRYCPRPFVGLTVDAGGDAYLCHAAGIATPAGSVRDQPLQALADSDLGRSVRQAVMDGSFRYCNRLTCPAITGDALALRDETDPQWQAVRAIGTGGQPPRMPTAPWSAPYGLVTEPGAPLRLFTDVARWAEAVAELLPGTPAKELATALILDEPRAPVGVYQSPDHYEAWLTAEDDPFVCSMVTVAPHIPQVPCLTPRDAAGAPLSKLDFLIRIADGKPPPEMLTGAPFAATRGLFRAGRLEEARDFLDRHSARQRHFLYDQARMVLAYALSGRAVPDHLADVLGRSDHFAKRYCPRPFRELNVEAGGGAFLCHSLGINIPAGPVQDGDLGRLLNSGTARFIRRSILDGSFRCCNRLLCPSITGGTLPLRDDSDPEWQAIRAFESGCVERVEVLTSPIPFLLVTEPGGAPRLFHDVENLTAAVEHALPGTPVTGLVAAMRRDNAGNPADVYEALELYEAWLTADDDPLACTIVTVGSQFPPMLCLRPRDGIGEPLSKVDFLVRMAADRPPPVFIAAPFAATRALYRAGRIAEARDLMERHIARQSHFLFEQAHAVLTYAASGRPVPAHLQDVLGHSDHFQGRFCTLPFYEMTIGVDGSAYLCCPSYLNLTAGNILTDKVSDIVNSETAIRIRRSILDGDFKYCNRLSCSFIAGDNLPTREQARAHPFFRKVIDEDRAELDVIHRMSLALDRSCNLSCPSCRSEVIIEKGQAVAAMMKATRDVILPMLKKIKVMQMNGYGEFAMSEPCRLILKSINREEYPDLKLDLITNALLFDGGFWQKFPNAHSMIRTVRVSIDGATKDTYERLRRGGDFGRLQQNMAFLASLRRQGMFEELSILCVYQLDNFREMKRMAEWAIELGCDRIYFEKLLNWSSYGSDAGYVRRAVHLLENPHYAEFREIVSDPIFHHPAVVRDWIDTDAATGIDTSQLAFLPLALTLEEGQAPSTIADWANARRQAAALADSRPAVAALLRGIAHDTRGEPFGAYDAVADYDAWMAAPDDPCGCAIETMAGGTVFVAVKPDGGPMPAVDKARMLLRLNELKDRPFLHGGVFAAARTLFRAGLVAEARDGLKRCAEREFHFIEMPALDVAERTLSGEAVPPHLRGVFGAESATAGRFCPRPFTDLNVERDGNLYVCHSHYLNLPAGSLDGDGLAAAVNSDTVRRIRDSVLDGSFTACNPLHCAALRTGTLPTREEARADPYLRTIIDEHRTRLDRVERLVWPVPFLIDAGDGAAPQGFRDMAALEAAIDGTPEPLASLLRALCLDASLRGEDNAASVAHYMAWLDSTDDTTVCVEDQPFAAAGPLLLLRSGGAGSGRVLGRTEFLLRLNEARMTLPDVGLFRPYLVGAVCAAARTLLNDGRRDAAAAALSEQLARERHPMVEGLLTTMTRPPAPLATHSAYEGIVPEWVR